MNYEYSRTGHSGLLKYKAANFLLAFFMSMTPRDEAHQFLTALGEQLGSHDAEGNRVNSQGRTLAQEYAKKLLWQIAPLSSGRRGAPTEFRGYSPEHGETIAASVELLIDCLASVYCHEAVANLLAENKDLRVRSRRNLRAMVHPQNLLRPFDALHTIGRAFRPLFVLRPYIDRDVSRDFLRRDFELVGPEEMIGGWSKAWFIGLLATTYLCWRWHGEISVSSEYPGWYSTTPLKETENVEPFTRNRVHLVSEDIDALTFTELGDDWTHWHPREKQAYGADLSTCATGKISNKFNFGPIPDRPSPPRFENYSDWMVAALGLYSGANDQRLDGKELASCLLTPAETTAQGSNLHAIATMVSGHSSKLFGRLNDLLEVLPQPPDFFERESPSWGVMMRTIFKEYCRDYRRSKNHHENSAENRDLGNWKVACYPIEFYSNKNGIPTVGGLSSVLATTMPHFRNLTSRAWMFYLDEPSFGRLSHPDERVTPVATGKNRR